MSAKIELNDDVIIITSFQYSENGYQIDYDTGDGISSAFIGEDHILANDLGLGLDAVIDDLSLSNLTLNGALMNPELGTREVWYTGDYSGGTYSMWEDYDVYTLRVDGGLIWFDETEVGGFHGDGTDYYYISNQNIYSSFWMDMTSDLLIDWTVEFDYTVTVSGEQYTAHAKIIYDIGYLEAVPELDLAIDVELDGDGKITILDEVREAYSDFEQITVQVYISSETRALGAKYESINGTYQLVIPESAFADLEPGDLREFTISYSIRDGVRSDYRELTLRVHGEMIVVDVDESGTAVGSDYSETLEGDEGDNTMLGGGGNDIIAAGAGADTLDGGDGDDRLDGGEGDDLLVGGAGDDTYILAPGSGVDRIVDDGGIIEMLADIPGDMISMILYEVDGKTELHISLLDEEGNETGDKLIIENFATENGNSGSGGSGFTKWRPKSPSTGESSFDWNKVVVRPDLKTDSTEHKEFVIKPIAEIETQVEILDFDASDLRLMRDAENPDDLIVYFRDDANISLRIEDQFDEQGNAVPAVRGIVFHESEDLMLTGDLSLEGTAEDELIRASGHDDMLIGAGGDDVFVGTKGELHGDEIADINKGDGIQVLGEHFTKEHVKIGAGGLVQIDLDGDSDTAELEFTLQNWEGISYKVEDLGDGGTLIDFGSIAPTAEARSGGAICVVGGARIDLDRLFSIDDVDGDLAGVEVKVSFANIDLSAMEAAFDAGTIGKNFGLTFEQYLDEINLGMVEQGAIGLNGLYIGEESCFLTVEQFENFEFLNLGAWFNPGEILEGPASLLYEQQAFDGFIEFSLRSVDDAGSTSEWTSSKVYTDEYKQKQEGGGSINWDGVDVATSALAAATSSLMDVASTLIEAGLNALRIPVDDRAVLSLFDKTDGIAENVMEVVGKAIDAKQLYDAFNNIEFMTDRQFTAKVVGQALDTGVELIVDVCSYALSAALGPVGPIAGLLIQLIEEAIDLALTAVSGFERLANSLYEAIWSENPEGKAIEVVDLAEMVKQVLVENQNAIAGAFEKTEVMRSIEELTDQMAAVEFEDLLQSDANLLENLANLKSINVIGGEIAEVRGVEGGSELIYRDGDEQKSIFIKGIDPDDIETFDNENEYFSHLIENSSPRDDWERWVGSAARPRHLEGTDHDDLMIGTKGDDSFKVGGGDDEVYGAEGADQMIIDAEKVDEVDTMRFVDLNFEEGDTIVFRNFDQERVIASAEDLQEYVDAGYADVTAWDDESGDLDVTFHGLDADMIEASNEIEAGNGASVIFGRGGDDVLGGGNGGDMIDGGTGDDALTGGNGADDLRGGSGDDMLDGGNGADLLNGGEGDDILSGGKGADIFVFGRNSGRDTITDFEKQDRIDLSELDVIYSDLTVEQVAGGVEVSGFDDMGSEIFLEGISAKLVTEDSFIFS